MGTPLPPNRRLVAVAQLDRLVRAGRGARRHRRAAPHAALEHHVDLDRRIAAAVQDLAGDDVDDGGHAGLAQERLRVRPFRQAAHRLESASLAAADALTGDVNRP